jgi:transposase
MAEAGETSSITSAPRSSRPAVDDRTSKAVGAHFGLTLKKYQSGKTDVTGRISKIGDRGVRRPL